MEFLKFFAKKHNCLPKKAWTFLQAFLLTFLLISCVEKKATERKISPEQAALIKRGKSVYMTYCIACHNMNPKLSGGTGPANWGPSLELVTQKVIYGKYPTGYRPKRKTKAMPTFEDDLEDDIPAIHAFLNH